MYGVIIWAKPSEGQAIIWCEDQADLAYVSEANAAVWKEQTARPGDLVWMRHIETGDRRMCKSLEIIDQAFNTALAEELKGVANDCCAAGRRKRLKLVPKT